MGYKHIQTKVLKALQRGGTLNALPAVIVGQYDLGIVEPRPAGVDQGSNPRAWPYKTTSNGTVRLSRRGEYHPCKVVPVRSGIPNTNEYAWYFQIASLYGSSDSDTNLRLSKEVHGTSVCLG